MSYQQFNSTNKTSRTSNLNQLIDIIQEDISGSSSRRKYQVFITGGIGPGVTSSLYQSVYDQDYSLQTANPMLDLTCGLFFNANVTNTVSTAPGFSATAGGDVSKISSTTKLLFASESMMMREKVNIYRQYASYLLGDPSSYFYLASSTYPANNGTAAASSTTEDRIDEALFLNVRRLFARDKIRKETFAVRLFQSASISGFDDNTVSDTYAATLSDRTGSNLSLNGLSAVNLTGHQAASPSGVFIVADIGSNTNYHLSPAGDVSRILNASNTAQSVGLLFYDAGIAVLDMKKCFFRDQHVHGLIDAMNGVTPKSGSFTSASGLTFIGTPTTAGAGSCGNPNAKFIPDFIVSGSIDNIIDHISTTRMGSGSLTALAFQNQTKIQSRIYFCKAPYSDFNYSSNPTFSNATDGTLNVITDPSDPDERSFTFITTICLLDSSFKPVAIAKLNRPIEKNDETELTIRVRLDF
jgi:hypothetical protein